MVTNLPALPLSSIEHEIQVVATLVHIQHVPWYFIREQSFKIDLSQQNTATVAIYISSEMHSYMI